RGARDGRGCRPRAQGASRCRSGRAQSPPPPPPQPPHPPPPPPPHEDPHDEPHELHDQPHEPPDDSGARGWRRRTKPKPAAGSASRPNTAASSAASALAPPGRIEFAR